MSYPCQIDVNSPSYQTYDTEYTCTISFILIFQPLQLTHTLVVVTLFLTYIVITNIMREIKEKTFLHDQLLVKTFPNFP